MGQSGDFTVTQGDVRLTVTGLSKAMRAFTAAGADAGDMRDAMHRLGTIVGDHAKPRTRRATGRMAGTIRAGKGKTKAVVRMGGSAAPYAPIQHYGWPARNITPAPSLVDALQATRPQVFAQLEREIDALLADNDLT